MPQLIVLTMPWQAFSGFLLPCNLKQSSSDSAYVASLPAYVHGNSKSGLTFCQNALKITTVIQFVAYHLVVASGIINRMTVEIFKAFWQKVSPDLEFPWKQAGLLIIMATSDR